MQQQQQARANAAPGATSWLANVTQDVLTGIARSGSPVPLPGAPGNTLGLQGVLTGVASSASPSTASQSTLSSQGVLAGGIGRSASPIMASQSTLSSQGVLSGIARSASPITAPQGTLSSQGVLSGIARSASPLTAPQGTVSQGVLAGISRSSPSPAQSRSSPASGSWAAGDHNARQQGVVTGMARAAIPSPLQPLPHNTATAPVVVGRTVVGALGSSSSSSPHPGRYGPGATGTPVSNSGANAYMGLTDNNGSAPAGGVGQPQPQPQHPLVGSTDSAHMGLSNSNGNGSAPSSRPATPTRTPAAANRSSIGENGGGDDVGSVDPGSGRATPTFSAHRARSSTSTPPGMYALGGFGALSSTGSNTDPTI